MANPDTTASFEDVTVLRDSGKAILVVIEGDEHWIPKSVIHADSEVYEDGTEGILIVQRWFAKKAELL